MKIKTKNLRSSIEFPLILAKSKNLSPVAHYLRFQASGGRLSIQASGANEFVEQFAECDGDLSPVCVSAYSFSSLLQFFGEEVEFKNEDSKLKISSNGKFSLAIIDANDFNALSHEDCKAIGINAGDLCSAIESVKFIAHSNPAFPEFHGVYFWSEAKKAVAEATNRVSYARCEKAVIASECEVFIPLPFVGNLCKALRNDECQIKVSESMIWAVFKDGSYGCSLGNQSRLKTAAFLNVKREDLGEITTKDWLSAFSGAIELHGNDSDLCKASIENGNFSYSGKNGQINLKLSDKLKKCRLNVSAPTFQLLLKSLPEKTKLEIGENKALFLSAGDVTIIGQQLKES